MTDITPHNIQQETEKILTEIQKRDPNGYPCRNNCGAMLMQPSRTCPECSAKADAIPQARERLTRINALLETVFGTYSESRLRNWDKTAVATAQDAVDEMRPLYICAPPGMNGMGFAVAILRYKLVEQPNINLTPKVCVEDERSKAAEIDRIHWMVLPDGNWSRSWDRLELLLRQTPILVMENFGWSDDGGWSAGVRALNLRLPLFSGGTIITSNFSPRGIAKMAENRKGTKCIPFANLAQDILPRCCVITLQPETTP